jgi:ABC-type nitrate/sulfonate/bicarbonate transport system substrate-binding protein
LEYRTDSLTVEEYLLHKSILRCCGDCYGYYEAWAQLLNLRSLGRYRPVDQYLRMPRYRFLEEVAACSKGIREGEEVAKVVEGINKGWQWEGKNPLERWPEDKAKKLTEYRESLDRERP